MRPLGEVRLALRKAAEQAHRDGVAASWRDLACRAQVGFKCARVTVENMARAGELRVVGTVAVVGAARPMNAYAPADQAGSGALQIDSVMRAWRA